MLVQGAQVRSFAEATLQKPDIPVHGIHGRYALALFEAGAKQGQLDRIDTDLKQVLCARMCSLYLIPPCPSMLNTLLDLQDH